MNKHIIVNDKLKRWIKLMLFVIVLATLIGGILYDNRSKSKKNTEQITGTLENIEVYDPPRGLTQIYVTIDSKRFVLVWVNSPQKYQTMLNNIKIGQEVSVLVVKNNIFHLQPEPEIVDLRSNSEIYYSVDNHNSNAFIARLLVLVVFIPHTILQNLI